MSRIDNFLKKMTLKQFLFDVSLLVLLVVSFSVWLYFSDNELFNRVLEVGSQPLLG